MDPTLGVRHLEGHNGAVHNAPTPRRTCPGFSVSTTFMRRGIHGRLKLGQLPSHAELVDRPYDLESHLGLWIDASVQKNGMVVVFLR